jgi:hypothetical protein
LRNSWPSRVAMPFLKARIMPGLALIVTAALLVWLTWKAFSVAG